MGNARWTLQGPSGRKAGNLKEVGLGGLSGVEKIEVLDGGRYEVVVNSRFEDLEGRVEPLHNVVIPSNSLFPVPLLLLTSIFSVTLPIHYVCNSLAYTHSPLSYPHFLFTNYHATSCFPLTASLWSSVFPTSINLQQVKSRINHLDLI